MRLIKLRKEIYSKRNVKKAKVLQGFFKTEKGEYGEGDRFLGITVPESRKIAIKYRSLNLKEIKILLNSKIHEERLIALLILINKYKLALKTKDEKTKSKIYNFYLTNKNNINNWDLVDLSCPKIIGDYLTNKNRKVLYALAESKNLWERRISIISTLTFIKNNDFLDTIKLAEILIKDKQDLIHKAVGWMLREVGKKDKKVLILFLQKNYKLMPRTMLRYAIEKFPNKERKVYLNKEK